MQKFELVIAGGGLAAARAIKCYRESGGRGQIALLSKESDLPYHRPALSKRYLRGETTDARFAEDAAFYRDHDVEVLLETTVTGVDAGSRTVATDGGTFQYNKLLIATGATPRRLEVSGAELEAVYALRTLRDSQAIRAAARSAEQAVVVGGGFIGMEVAASLRQLGLAVTLIHLGRGLFDQFRSSELSDELVTLYREHGVELLLEQEVAGFGGDDRLSYVKTRSGLCIEAEIAVVGVGVLPNVDFLADSGLALNNGVVVNQRFETRAPGVFAAGDVANFFDPLYGRQRRIEHWSNANYQGTEVGKVLAGTGGGYYTVSSFFSEVFGTTLKVSGDVSRFDELTTEGSLTSGTAHQLRRRWPRRRRAHGRPKRRARDAPQKPDRGARPDGRARARAGRREVAMTSRLHQLSALGQSVWIDYLSRELIESGALTWAVDEDAVVGVTSNPSIFEKALARGHAYDEQIAASTDGDAESVFLSLALRDVAAACDLLRPVWERTEARDGYVSIEVEPNLADDTEATIAQATRFHEAIARPNLLVKIPATDAGVPAIEEMTARGSSINVTLIFSLPRHRQVADAYLRGLERLVANGGDPSRVHSVASFFVSRVDTETDRRLDELGRGDLKGRLGIANAKLAYQQYKELFANERWQTLASRGASKQRCLWASTSTKDPSLRDTLYVEELIGPGTISTMPAETIRAFQDHGRVEVRLESDLQQAQYLFNQLYAAGVAYEDVVATLEREGIEKFVASFNELLQGIAEKRRQLVSAA
jgi:transaldolase